MPDRQSSGIFEDSSVTMGGDLESLIGYNLKRAYVIIHNDFSRTLGEDGFSTRVFSALTLIVQFPNITQSELARMLGIERSGLVAIVDELEKRGLVQRNRVPGDRRVQALSPTAKGQEACARATQAVRAHEDNVLADLTMDERKVLMSLLRRIRKAEEKS